MKRLPLNFNRSIFIDSSDLTTIQEWNATGIIDGVTMNQMIMLKDGIKPKDFNKVVKSICREMKGKPVSVELADSSATEKEMLDEAKRYNALAPNIVVKVPLIPDTTKSLKVIYELAKRNIAVNVTLMMTYEQMVLAIAAVRHCSRPSFVSIFWGRSIEDQANYRSRFDFMANHARVGLASHVDESPQSIVRATAEFLKEGGYDNPKIIVGSMRSAIMVGESFAAGGHIVTIPPDILYAMLFSQRTMETMQQFDDAWKELLKKK